MTSEGSDATCEALRAAIRATEGRLLCWEGGADPIPNRVIAGNQTVIMQALLELLHQIRL